MTPLAARIARTSGPRPRVIAVLLALLALLGAPTGASAHPLGNLSVNRYAAVTISPERVAVDLVIDAAEIPTLDAIARLDLDGDGALDGTELAAAGGAACAAAAGTLRVELGERELRLAVETATITLLPGAAGLETMRTECLLHGGPDRPLAAAAALRITHLDERSPAGWREIVVRGDGVRVDAADTAIDRSSRLTAYPDDPLAPVLAERSVALFVRPGSTGVDVPDDPIAGAQAGPRPGVESVWAVDLRELTPAVAFIGLLLAFLSGAGHAASPGHGKTLLAAYLLGARGRARDAVLLGLAVTVSHTAGVLLLGGLVLLAGQALPPDRLYPVLSSVSGIMVIGIGAWLLVGCLRRLRAADHDPHSHPHPHPHSHSHPHPHPHGAVAADGQPGSLGRGGVIVIGLAGGLVPSTAALVLLLGAIAAGRPEYGIGLALAFGAGMAGVLVVLGLLVVRGRDRAAAVARRLPSVVRMAAVVPWVAALVVLGSGVVLTGRAIIGAL